MHKNQKQDHFVQQRYLKYFSFGSERTHIFAYDKDKDEVQRPAINRTACERGFYDIDLAKYHSEVEKNEYRINKSVLQDLMQLTNIIKSADDLLTNYIEPIFDEIENVIQRHSSRMLMPNPSAIESAESKARISYYIAYQYIRTRRFREWLVEKISTKDVVEELGYEELLGMPKQTRKILHTMTLLNNELLEHIANTINEGIWIFGTNRTDEPFITSDHPVVVKQGMSAKTIFADVGGIVYPLTPKLVLVIYPPTSKDIKDLKGNEFYSVKNKGVDYFNGLQKEQAGKYIYSDSENTLMKMIKKRE